MSLQVLSALPQHAGPMAEILNEIIAIGGSTAYRGVFDERRIVETFIAPRLGIGCFAAVDGTRILGFQALEWCDPEWPGPDRLPADWAVIATYVAPQAHGRGVGRTLFLETTKAAKLAGVCFIDATIRKENAGGQAFYGGIGFTDYRSGAETVSKRFAPG